MAAAIRRALISVSDKTALTDLARRLTAMGVSLVATGGTARQLTAEGFPITDVSEVTGFPEILDGRVKTLHPMIHAGLLARRDDPAHMRTLADMGIATIDLVVVNLYPFEATIAANRPFDEVIENIDVGGPSMIRAAAKNFRDVVVVVDPGQYPMLLEEMERADGVVSEALRRRLATEAFARTAAYDATIANWLIEHGGGDAPPWRAFGGTLVQRLRYGENPHQQASFYATGSSGLARARQVQGKELSFNNINDADAALKCVAEFRGKDEAACVIVKHANPCGVATRASLAEAYRAALACDPTSAFGGIVAFNQSLTAEAASEVVKIFTEVVVAPDADAEAIALFAAKPNLRLLLASPPSPDAREVTVRSVTGGLLVQDRDAEMVAAEALKVVTKKAPTNAQTRDLLFAMRVVKHVKSNAIVIAKEGATLGIGAGQMSRVDSTKIAAARARQFDSSASVAASDAFFPFADGLRELADAGVTAVIQPGGSMRDGEVIAAADELGLAMVFTGLRHFLH